MVTVRWPEAKGGAVASALGTAREAAMATDVTAAAVENATTAEAAEAPKAPPAMAGTAMAWAALMEAAVVEALQLEAEVRVEALTVGREPWQR